MKKTLIILYIIALGSFQINAQSTENKSWSIDYLDWNSNGQPSLYIDCGNDAAFNLSDEITIETWIRSWNFVENRKVMGKIGFENGIIDDGYVLGFQNQHVYAEYFNPNVQQVPFSGVGVIPVDSAYIHMATVYSTSQGKIRNYVNGILSGETDLFPSNPVGENDQSFIIGNAPWDMLSFQFYGDLDEVRIWNIARTEEEIRSNMHIPLSGSESNLVSYYTFNEAEEENVPDSSPNGFDGVLVNSDHSSTSFSVSGAPVGNETMSTMLEINAAWYNTNENFHKITTDNGLSVITDIDDKQYTKYLVLGMDGDEGSSSENAPLSNPANFTRTAREWYMKCASDVQGTITIDLDETLVGTAIPDNSDLNQYALLYREDDQDSYTAIANPTSPITGIFQFFDIDFKDGFYALGHTSGNFEIITSVNDIFPKVNASIHPNPSNGQIQINADIDIDDIYIYNVHGDLVRQISSINSRTFNIDISHLISGIYTVQLSSSKNLISKKIIKL